jgi:hypothetical protein
MKGLIFNTYMDWFGLGSKNKDEGGVFTCKYCDMKFEDKERLKRHAKKAHSEKGGDLPNFNPFGSGS